MVMTDKTGDVRMPDYAKEVRKQPFKEDLRRADTRTAEGLEQFVCTFDDERARVRSDRGKRYGNPQDVLANVADFGTIGAAVSLNECNSRIKNAFVKLSQGWQPEDWGAFEDDMIDAALDACNYAQYVVALLLREKK
jgi:hypothetical protein